MQENNAVPYIAFEASLAREERHARRLLIALVISVVLLFSTNLAWLYVWNNYDYETADTTEITSASQDGSGVNIVGGGDINYGAESNNN